jgi:hypothetical protein
MSQAWADQLDLLIRARTPILWIRSREEERIIALLEGAARRLGQRSLLVWDFITGLGGLPSRQGRPAAIPSPPWMPSMACPRGLRHLGAQGFSSLLR